MLVPAETFEPYGPSTVKVTCCTDSEGGAAAYDLRAAIMIVTRPAHPMREIFLNQWDEFND